MKKKLIWLNSFFILVKLSLVEFGLGVFKIRKWKYEKLIIGMFIILIIDIK